MKNSEMNRIIGMLDDDVVAEGLSAKSRTGFVIGRKLAVALIAATLAVALLFSGVMIGLGRRESVSERVNVLPPVGMTVIKHVASGSQITKETVHNSGYYPTVESNQYWLTEPTPYVTVGGLEMTNSLYNELVKSGDANRTWSIEVSISPNLYATKDYIEQQAAQMLSNYTAENLERLIDEYESLKDNIDIDALYAKYGHLYDLVDVYKYIKSGELDRDLLNADVYSLKNKATEIIDHCGEIREGYWKDLEPIVLAELEKLGVPFVKEGNSYVIFVTEGELLSLAGIDGLKFENAYYKIDVNEFDPNAITERAGKKITKRLADAFAGNEGENILFAVLVETAGVAEMGDKSAYEQAYVELFSDYASRKVTETLLRNAVKSDADMQKALELCGAEMVAKYIKDGVFDSALFESDTAAMGAEIDEMKTLLYGDNAAEVYDAFKDSVNYIEITAQGSVIIYVTAAEFDALAPTGDFVFNLAA